MMDPVTLLVTTVGAQIGTRLTVALAGWLLRRTRVELVRAVDSALSVQDLRDAGRRDAVR